MPVLFLKNIYLFILFICCAGSFAARDFWLKDISMGSDDPSIANGKKGVIFKEVFFFYLSLSLPVISLPAVIALALITSDHK